MPVRMEKRPSSPALDLYALQRERGGFVYDDGRRWLGPGPGHSRRDASLSVWIAPDGRPVVHSFAGGPFPACAEHLGIERASAARMDRSPWLAAKRWRQEELRQQAAETGAFVRRTWEAAQPVEGTPAEAYLRRRGVLAEGVADLRFHPATPRILKPRAPGARLSVCPALLALVRDAAGKPCALHATFLRHDGSGKAFGERSRLMFGPTAGGAVRLAPIGSDRTLAVGEGIETALAFAKLKRIPTWAALSTSGLMGLGVPAGVRRLLIAADNDDGGAGMKAALTLAERAQRLCAVEVHPAPDGKDWADVAEASHV